MADTPLPVTYYAKTIIAPYNLAASAGLSLLLCLLVACFIRVPAAMELRLALLALLWGAGFFFFLVRLPKYIGTTQPYLDISALGIFYFERGFLIHWHKIAGIISLRHPFLGNVGVMLTHPVEWLAKLDEKQRAASQNLIAACGSPIIINPATLHLSVDELIARLQHYKNTYSAQTAAIPNDAEGFRRYGKDYLGGYTP